MLFRFAEFSERPVDAEMTEESLSDSMSLDGLLLVTLEMLRGCLGGTEVPRVDISESLELFCSTDGWLLNLKRL